jgi:hypothetical protein
MQRLKIGVLKFPKSPGATSKFWVSRKVTTQKYFGTTSPHSVTRATRRSLFVHPYLRLRYRVTDTKDRRNRQGVLSHFVKTPKSPNSE